MRLLWVEDPPATPKPATQRDYETVGLVLAGRAELEIDGQRAVLEPGDSWLVPKGASHAGVLVVLGTLLLLTTLGMAIGFSADARNVDPQKIGRRKARWCGWSASLSSCI
jgi:hypothetical protein